MQREELKQLTPKEQAAMEALGQLPSGDDNLILLTADVVRGAKSVEQAKSFLYDFASQGKDNPDTYIKVLGRNAWEALKAMLLECDECPDGVCWHRAVA